MISLSWSSSFEPNSYDADKHIGSLMKAYKSLPRHIAKKHLKAAMRRVLKPALPILRRNTPPLGTKRGRRSAGAKKRSTGELRKSVATKAGQTGRNSDFDSFVWGVLGYRMRGQDRKAIWMQFGTSGGVKPYDMIGRTMSQFGPIAAASLAQEMAAGLEKAAAEIGGGKNPGYGG